MQQCPHLAALTSWGVLYTFYTTPNVLGGRRWQPYAYQSFSRGWAGSVCPNEHCHSIAQKLSHLRLKEILSSKVSKVQQILFCIDCFVECG